MKLRRTKQPYKQATPKDDVDYNLSILQTIKNPEALGKPCTDLPKKYIKAVIDLYNDASIQPDTGDIEMSFEEALLKKYKYLFIKKIKKVNSE